MARSLEEIDRELVKLSRDVRELERQNVQRASERDRRESEFMSVITHHVEQMIPRVLETAIGPFRAMIARFEASGNLHNVEKLMGLLTDEKMVLLKDGVDELVAKRVLARQSAASLEAVAKTATVEDQLVSTRLRKWQVAAVVLAPLVALLSALIGAAIASHK